LRTRTSLFLISVICPPAVEDTLIGFFDIGSGITTEPEMLDPERLDSVTVRTEAIVSYRG